MPMGRSAGQVDNRAGERMVQCFRWVMGKLTKQSAVWKGKHARNIDNKSHLRCSFTDILPHIFIELLFKHAIAIADMLEQWLFFF